MLGPERYTLHEYFMLETAVDSVLLLFPIGYFLWRRRSSKVGISNVLLGCYVYPLILLTILSADGYSLPNFSISSKTANLLRVMVHGLFAWWFVRRALKGRIRFRAVPGTVPALVAIALMLLSAVWLGSGQDALLRIGLLLILWFNIFVLVPTVSGDDPNTYYRELTDGTVFLAFYLAGLSAITFLLNGNYPEWSLRLGRPLNPNFLSFLVVFAFISAAFVKRNIAMLGGLLIALIATGSRLPLAFALLWLLVQGYNNTRGWRRAGLLSVAFLGIGVVYWIQADEVRWDREGIFERSDVWSGRMVSWIQALDSIETSPLLGQGDRAYVETTDAEEPLRTHNMLLENSVSYGIPASLAAFLVYIAMALVTYRAWRHRDVLPNTLQFAPLLMYVVAFELGTTFVETSIWTNLGDGGNILFFLFVGPGLANARAALTARKKKQDLQRSILQKRSQVLPASQPL
jgi:O-antigen ligase